MTTKILLEAVNEALRTNDSPIYYHLLETCAAHIAERDFIHKELMKQISELKEVISTMHTMMQNSDDQKAWEYLNDYVHGDFRRI